MQIVDKIRPLLGGEVPKELRLELAEVRAKTYAELLKKRRQMLYPKDPQYTELDRRTMMDGDVAELEADYQLLTDLTNILN